MKVYDMLNRGPQGEHTVFVSPAALDKSANNPEWFDESGKAVQIAVRFRNGRAEVEDSLGRILVHHNLARKSRPLIQPAY